MSNKTATKKETNLVERTKTLLLVDIMGAIALLYYFFSNRKH